MENPEPFKKPHLIWARFRIMKNPPIPETQEGLFLSADVNVSGFTCMRFGWATQHLVPAPRPPKRFLAVAYRYTIAAL